MPRTRRQPRATTDNILYYGDNLDVLRRDINDESVDLIYLDPPFNSNRAYNVLFHNAAGDESPAQIQAFGDTWRWSQETDEQLNYILGGGVPGTVIDAITAMRGLLGQTDLMAYLVMMTTRLVELRRVLKDTGSLYLHCDPTASHYLKMILDAVFGPRNFRSEIVWRRSSAHNKLSQQFGPIHDIILFYSKGDELQFHPGRTPYPNSYIEGRFRREDAHGRFRSNELTGAGTRNGASGQPWRGFAPTPRGRHWAIPGSLKELLPNDGKGMTSQEKLDHLAGLPDSHIEMPADERGWPTYRQYIGAGVLYQDIWAYQPGTRGCLWETDQGIDEDVKWLEAGEEKLGFDTQKPVGLLARIINSSSQEGDTVLDPFCGCGTTVDAAQLLRRRWVGIDITYIAIDLIQRRLASQYGNDASYRVDGIPTDIEGAQALFNANPFDFERWAVSLVDATPNEKQVGDRGVDGRVRFHADERRIGKVIVSVKGGEAINPAMLRDLVGTVETERAEMGILLTMTEPTPGIVQAAARAGLYSSALTGRSFPKIQVLTIQQLLAGVTPQMPTAITPYIKPKQRAEEQLTLRTAGLSFSAAGAAAEQEEEVEEEQDD